MRWFVVVSLAVSGCNQVFGLGPTELVDTGTFGDDRDGDGVADGVDNCPDAANTTQRDADADLIGDACDPCSFAFDLALDRDTDGVAAMTDNCPGMGNMSQADSDGDAIGDACDPTPGELDRRRCFADFWIGVQEAWPIMDPWKFAGSAGTSFITHLPSEATPFWLGAFASGLAPLGIAVQVELTSPQQPPTTNVELATGIAVGAADQTNFAACELVMSMANPTLRVRVSDSTGPLAEMPLAFTPHHVTLVYRGSPGAIALHCTASTEFGDSLLVTGTSSAAFDPSVLYLTATNATAVFHSLTVYETP